MNLRVEQGDITTFRVDAIVNAANESLLGGGGVDGAVHEAAGPELMQACREIPEVRPGVRCPTGEARITPAFGLPAHVVIHAVGPVWRGGSRDERDLLAACYRSIFALCVRHEIHTIAIPAISCGAYGFPLAEACTIATREVRDALRADTTVRSVVLVALEHDVRDALERAIRAPGPR